MRADSENLIPAYTVMCVIRPLEPLASGRMNACSLPWATLPLVWPLNTTSPSDFAIKHFRTFSATSTASTSCGASLLVTAKRAVLGATRDQGRRSGAGAVPISVRGL